jgi:predicted aldo/keto reductase-like oxidoreductase
MPGARRGQAKEGKISMITKVFLGKTGLEVTRLGFGGIPIQRVDERQAVETVLHAVSSGVDFIDTSRAYTTSERRIGLALKDSGRRVVLATKSLEQDADGMRRDVETSLRELGLAKIDLYQCHFVKDFDAYGRVTGRGGALEGLLKAREEGLIGHVGITSHSLDVLTRAVDDGLFETIMACYSFLEPRAEEELIPRAVAAGVGVITMKAFSGGVIDRANLAIKYALAPAGTVVIPGVESREIFDENWEIFRGDLALDAGERRQIEAIRAEFDRKFCRRCDYCQPCPENIPIQTVMGIRYLVKRMGRESLQGPWVKGSMEAAKRCTACGACLERCPYELPIPDLIRENAAWVEAELEKQEK